MYSEDSPFRLCRNTTCGGYATTALFLSEFPLLDRWTWLVAMLWQTSDDFDTTKQEPFTKNRDASARSPLSIKGVAHMPVARLVGLCVVFSLRASFSTDPAC